MRINIFLSNGPCHRLNARCHGTLRIYPQVSSYGGDAKKTQSNRRPRRATADDDAAGGSRQPQASATAATTASTGWATAPARSRPETTSQAAPSPRPTDGLAASGRITWRAPSRRHSLRQPGPGDSSSSGGLWTAATTLGVIVLLGRVAAVVFLCSCLYGARFVRAWAAGGAGASAKALQLSSGGVGGVSSSSRRFGDPVEVAAGDKVVAEMCATEECKKKVVMAGLLDRAGKTPSSRFGR